MLEISNSSAINLYEALAEWQARWDKTEKGSWTYAMIPDVKIRYFLTLKLDHYIT